MVGTALNHYRVTKALGRGGMDEVYLADDTRLNQISAFISVAVHRLIGELA